MATYKETVGTSVANISGNSGVVEGQLWYDTSSSEYKYQYLGAGAWATGGSLNTGRYTAADNIGIQTSALCATGQTPAYTANVENYNGSAWTEVNNVNTARSNAAGAGTTTSSLIAGGYAPGTAEEDATELYNGTSWTEVNDQNTARYGAAMGGADNTAALYAGGNGVPSGASAITECGIIHVGQKLQI
tara:strand:+ start:38 stop:604 length:567 start_codon:yes stop_codon:yes gene_type:complete